MWNLSTRPLLYTSRAISNLISSTQTVQYFPRTSLECMQVLFTRKMSSKKEIGEPVTIDGRQYRSVQEGLAQILAPYQSDRAGPRKGHNNDEGHQAVFYNPIQQFNRDLSVLAILTYGEGAIIEKEARLNVKHEAQKSKKTRASSKLSEHVKSANQNKRKASTEAQEDQGEEAQHISKRQRIDQNDTADAVETVIVSGDGEQGPPPAESDPPIPAQVDVLNESKKDNGNAKSKKHRQIPFTILDALSATGLRALRYAKEIPFATNIVANDLLVEAAKSIELNIDHNNVRDRVHSNVADARAYMYSKVGNEHQQPAKGYVHRFDVIDLDPYGTAAPFLDAALQALQDGGLLCVTCTDAGVFASNGYPEKAFALYGGTTVKGAFSHEGGLRLILHAISQAASKYGIAIEPLLSLSIDFYARLFVRVHKSQKEVKLLAGTTMLVYNCDNGCGAWTTQLAARNTSKADRVGDLFFKHHYAQAPNVNAFCEHCGKKTHLGGPMWAGPIHNPYFVQKILDRLPSLDTSVYGTTDRIRGMLTTALEEDLTLATSTDPLPTQSNSSEKKQQPTKSNNADTNPVDLAKTPDPRLIPRLPPQTIDVAPFFFIPNYLSKVLHCSTPSEDPLRGAIRHLGYRVTRSHCKAGSFKTNAPWSVLWEIMREWVRTKAPIKPGAVKPGMPGWKILQATRDTDVRQVNDFRDEIKERLDRCNGSVDELKTVLESAMWKIEQKQFDITSVTTAATTTTTDQGTALSSTSDRTVVEFAGQKQQQQPQNGIQRKSSAAQQQSEIDEDDQQQNGEVDDNSSKQLSSENIRRLNIVFDEKLGKEKSRSKLVRYQINPRANWGPMNRAGGAN